MNKDMACEKCGAYAGGATCCNPCQIDALKRQNDEMRQAIIGANEMLQGRVDFVSVESAKKYLKEILEKIRGPK